MRYEVIQFNRKRDSGLDLQNTLNEFASGGCAIASLRIADFDSEKKAIVELTIDEGSKAKQAVTVYGVDPLDSVVERMREHVGNLKSEYTIKAINLLPLGGNRALGVIITEALSEKKSGSDGSGKRKETTRKQDQGSDASADSATEGGTVD